MHDLFLQGGITWPVLLSFANFPSLIYLVSSPFLPDTPSYFILTGKRTQAAKTLTRLRKNISQVSVTLIVSLRSPSIINSAQHGFSDFVRKRENSGEWLVL